MLKNSQISKYELTLEEKVRNWENIILIMKEDSCDDDANTSIVPNYYYDCGCGLMGLKTDDDCVFCM